MNASLTQLRSELKNLTVELRQLGVSQPAYPVDLIDKLSRGTLVSCLEWARKTVDLIKSTV